MSRSAVIDFPPRAARPDLSRVRRMIQACLQCGTCSGSCPNAAAMDFTPRHLWRLVMLDRGEEIFRSRTFTLCSACYTCTLRCPRGLPLTEAMHALEQAAHRARSKRHRTAAAFHHHFLESIRREGRVNEPAFLMHYFAAVKDPLLVLRHAALGLRLAARGRLPLGRPASRARSLAALFARAAEVEASP
ncbi:MAG: 4Fe-4S dicluster domain-containing protein [Desulfobacterales bacterium]